ncbi:hypothetical protein P171DRAFT_179101 [Karstenula rhodostoma CBS 690.94]|uniref:Uncharacterized protein n=1 Tax=Karstenula rhodostoma CBS 690.94 TaxID=1392251 RepID=A0A9P4P6E0_9PLEO|nr:hypothetical protein P171DRAFT_179101 [Karstenula rhodostoma CBS 690.94]
MCKQAKTGYTDCPHVYADGDIEFCERALHPDVNAVCEDVEIYWNDLKFPGKCHWCQERDKKQEKKTWGGGKVKERPDWLK